MPRKAKKEKASSYRPTNFSMKNTSLLTVANGFILAEGKLSRDNICSMGSKTLFGQLKNDGYIKETKEQGIFKVTDKFEREFSKLTGKKIVYGGSGAGEQHSKTISDLVSIVPKSALINNEYKNGQQLITENRQNKKTPEFKQRVYEMKQEVYRAQRESEQAYKNIMSDSSISAADKTKAEIEYLNQKDSLEMKEKVLNDNKRGVSSPDMQIQLSRNEAQEYIENLREFSRQEEYCDRREQWEETINRMEAYAQGSPEMVLTINLEVVSTNYRTIDIQAKENWSIVYNEPVFYFDV